MMTTITVWLLIAVGGYYSDNVVVVGQFATLADCEHVRKSLPNGRNTKEAPAARCIEAKVVR